MTDSDNTPTCTIESGIANNGASNELLLEFLDSVMYKRFDTALSLCRRIIEDEPDNYQAHAFLPMLEEAHSMKSKGYFNPLEVSSEDESDEDSSHDGSEQKHDRRSSSSSEDWDYSTTSSESDDGSDVKADDE